MFIQFIVTVFRVLTFLIKYLQKIGVSVSDVSGISIPSLTSSKS